MPTVLEQFGVAKRDPGVNEMHHRQIVLHLLFPPDEQAPTAVHPGVGALPPPTGVRSLVVFSPQPRIWADKNNYIINEIAAGCQRSICDTLHPDTPALHGKHSLDINRQICYIAAKF